MATTVTSKGQVTIPKPIRDHLGIETGTRVSFELGADGGVTLKTTTSRAKPSRFEKLRGLADGGLSTDEIMALTRGE